MSKTPRKSRGVFILGVCLLTTAAGAQHIGDVYASDATVKGSVRYTASGLEIDNGSVITAGEHSASLRLARGGQVRICPGTNLTVNSSPKGQELMFAISAGSLEGEYDLPATADAILTPDFRILISGPAKVNVSITASANGVACVRSRGEDSYVIVSELMGDDFYRVKPNEQAVFHPGNVKKPELNDTASCGCPAPPPIQTTEVVPVAPPAQTPPAPTPEQKAAALAAIQNEPAVAATANAAASLAPQPAAQLEVQASQPPPQVQVQVDAPMIFRGKGSASDADVTATLARVHVERLPWPGTPSIAPQPPSPLPAKMQSAPEKRGFFRRLARALFGR